MKTAQVSLSCNQTKLATEPAISDLVLKPFKMETHHPRAPIIVESILEASNP